MIKNRVKNERGISLVSLAIAIVVLVILTNIIIYNIRNNLALGNLQKLKNDIGDLRDKISSYYSKNGEIPVKMEYTNIEHLRNAGIISEAIDSGKFLVIDLSAIENLTLNYGKDYEHIKQLNELTDDNAKKYTDLYIINEESHNIFYVEGIKVGKDRYYTDYTSADEKALDLKYKIKKVKPGETATSTERNNYEDENGDTATIPEGFKVSDVLDEDTVRDGLVVIAPDQSEFVWIPVPQAVSPAENAGRINKAMAIKNGSNYRGLLYNFSGTSSTEISGCTSTTSNFREPAYLTNATNGDASTRNNVGITETLLQDEYNDMMKSVEKYEGFYVGRYETSYDGNKVASKVALEPMTSGTSSGNMWYGMYDKQKKYASQNSIGNIIESSMIWGSQYDAMLNWILKGSDKNKVTKIIDTITGNQTGSDLEGVMNNIYDLTNNLMEWTMEAWDSYGRVARGAYGSGSSRSPADRLNGSNEPTNTYIPASSRITLYIKDDVTEDWTGSYADLAEDYTGYYADVDGNGIVDGIIYKDLAKNNTSGTFKKYTIGQEVGGFGNLKKPMISKASGTTGTDRFYVMALEDIGTPLSPYYWYFSAYNNENLGKIVGTMSNDVEYGKWNTKYMIDQWNKRRCGKWRLWTPKS